MLHSIDSLHENVILPSLICYITLTCNYTAYLLVRFEVQKRCLANVKKFRENQLQDQCLQFDYQNSEIQ